VKEELKRLNMSRGGLLALLLFHISLIMKSYYLFTHLGKLKLAANIIGFSAQLLTICGTVYWYYLSYWTIGSAESGQLRNSLIAHDRDSCAIYLGSLATLFVASIIINYSVGGHDWQNRSELNLICNECLFIVYIVVIAGRKLHILNVISDSLIHCCSASESYCTNECFADF